MHVLSGTEVKEKHSQQHEQQVDRFVANVLFLKQDCSCRETYYYAAPAYHRDDRDHRVGIAEGVEIDEVGTNKKKGDEKYRGAPYKRGGPFPLWIPQEQEYNGHHGHLVVGVPHLYGHTVEPVRHEVFVVQSAGRSSDGGEYNKENPNIVFKVDSLFFPRKGE